MTDLEIKALPPWELHRLLAFSLEGNASLLGQQAGLSALLDRMAPEGREGQQPDERLGQSMMLRRQAEQHKRAWKELAP